MKNQQGLRGAYRLFACQLCLATIIAVIAGLLADRTAACSAVLGGLVSALPNMLLARQLFQHQGAKAAKQIVNGFYKGEALKIALSIILFVLVFVFFKINPLVFFATYIMAQMVFWFAPLIFANK